MTTEPNRTELSADQVRAILAAPEFDGYGSTRLYGVFGPACDYSGQTTAIKSAYHVDRLEESGAVEFYAMHRPGGVPIGRA